MIWYLNIRSNVRGLSGKMSDESSKSQAFLGSQSIRLTVRETGFSWHRGMYTNEGSWNPLDHHVTIVLSTKRNSDWCWIYPKSVITIQIWFSLTRFRKYFFCVYLTERNLCSKNRHVWTIHWYSRKLTPF